MFSAYRGSFLPKGYGDGFDSIIAGSRGSVKGENLRGEKEEKTG
jgi:hypothetical protein